MGSTSQLIGGFARPEIQGHIHLVSNSNSPEPWALRSIVLARKNSCFCRSFSSHIHVVPKELRKPSHRWSSHPDILPKHSSGRCQICSTTVCSGHTDFSPNDIAAPKVCVISKTGLAVEREQPKHKMIYF